jgi:ATP-dependent RNA helicase RhlE
MTFHQFGLSEPILRGVTKAGYTTPTPIQNLAIRPILDGRDLIGCAQTGTGKTAAFVLPMLNRLSAGQGVRGRRQPVRALVITPTRELAHQIREAVSTYGQFLSLRAAAIYGGVGMENQIKHLERGVDIVIATPGRLLDHLQRATIDLSHVETLVLDEADRMLDMGFIHDVRRIIGAVPTARQTLLFSATMSAEVRELAARFMRTPEHVEAGERRNPAETIRQHFYSSTPQAKLDLLVHALEAEKMQSVLVFSRTKHGADKISRRLERKGISSMAIHSNRSQSQRQRALDGFRQGDFRVLVATDIAARGLDVDGISHVINYDIPRDAEDYIHRIGRTGRAGAAGDAITFIAHEDREHVQKIERFIGKKIAVRTYPGFTASAPEAPAAPAVRPSSGSRPSEPQARRTHRAAAPEHRAAPRRGGKPHRTKQRESKEGAWSNHPYHGGRSRGRHM